MIIRTYRLAALAAAVTGLAATLVAGGPAQAAPADEQTLIDAARTYFTGENSLLVDGGPAAAKDAEQARDLDVAAAFRTERDDRMEAREQLRGIDELAGVRYSAVDTDLTQLGTARTEGDTARISVRDHTTYTFAGAKDDPYSYTVRHDLSFARAEGGWALSGITTHDGPANLATPNRLNPQELGAVREVAARLRTDATVREDARLADPARKQGAADAAARASDEVRPAAAYDYQAMVDFATRHATPVPEDNVPYERDTNDCTNFISHALAAGGWAEEVGWYQSDSAWWYNFNPWPFPDNHSYTWGGAENWQRFARDESKRVYELPGPSSLAIADVVQFEIFEYSTPGQPGHTMMVTDFAADGTPKMSYHTNDTLNKPLSEILAAHDTGERFWYFRT